MRVCIIGTGYVGLTTGVCLAHFGSDVICVDKDAERVRTLKKGIPPIHEDGLKELMEGGRARGRLEFTGDLRYGVANSDIIFITVGTPSLPGGGPDLSAVRRAAAGIAECMDGYSIIVIKSTVPVGTQKLVSGIIKDKVMGQAVFDVLSNPEFLREGSAIFDTMHPDRVVIGADNPEAAKVLARLYRPIGGKVLITDPESAEMIKYASNAFLALKISFINEIANLCERTGADVTKVALGMGLDSRISPDFLKAGLGYGGSCFPKDTRALQDLARKNGCTLKTVESAIEVNEDQRLRAVEKLKAALGDLAGKTVGILGLSFKPNTDDIREAPSLDIIREIIGQGGSVKACDPAAVPNAKKAIHEVEYCDDAYLTAQGADALILVTEWEQYRVLDLKRLKSLMKRPVFIDGRNVYDVDAMPDLGFEYYCIGRRDYCHK
ncbi:MAG: UDP-glucose/GDP-mannose dehydrogenase family protein [Bacillota bacterium]|jgi:UDPglucose 6-dehydrogenase|nr:UDP-glucose/GDP-mannose dehydrogenase family protein [Bacillota bacterium]MDD3298796.1 UDP-glucose/GDP-mannose dehydrogenase family protein [Bacillota bacterium]MDD3850626.1 UDP-glucose/GDP-mannose dehydrogenase family protein [Bacillota bacterium]MDD4708153.1 UDP-glucose/GDP-mannose dehydrogenase family protein [Bacillota bacterium]